MIRGSAQLRNELLRNELLRNVLASPQIAVSILGYNNLHFHATRDKMDRHFVISLLLRWLGFSRSADWLLQKADRGRAKYLASPLFRRINSVIGQKTFPAPFGREFAYRTLELLRKS